MGATPRRRPRVSSSPACRPCTPSPCGSRHRLRTRQSWEMNSRAPMSHRPQAGSSSTFCSQPVNTGLKGDTDRADHRRPRPRVGRATVRIDDISPVVSTFLIMYREHRGGALQHESVVDERGQHEHSEQTPPRSRPARRAPSAGRGGTVVDGAATAEGSLVVAESVYRLVRISSGRGATSQVV